MRPETVRTIVGAFAFAAAALPIFPSGAVAQGVGARDYAGGGIVLGERGGGIGAAPVQTPSARIADAFEFSASAGFASDYIYRGTTLSDRKPVVGAAAEATFRNFYVGTTMASVKLPSQPAAELTFAAGVRPTLGKIEFDFGATYFYYPGEIPGSRIEYWEAAARADTTITEQLRVAGGFAWSPNVSNTGAWSKYVAGGAALDLGRNTWPFRSSASLSGGVGYFWFGNQSAELGGFPLPAYLNWNAGLTLSRGPFRFDLRYYDTNLSPENCYVFTGDPNATPGGTINPVTNPDGLRSRWCSSTVVAKFWFELN